MKNLPHAARVTKAAVMSVLMLSMFPMFMLTVLLVGPVLSMLLLPLLGLEQPLLLYFLHVFFSAVLRATRTARFDVCFDLRFVSAFAAGTHRGFPYVGTHRETIVVGYIRQNGLTARGTFVLRRRHLSPSFAQ